MSHRFRIQLRRASGSRGCVLSQVLSNNRELRYLESQIRRNSIDTGCVANKLCVANSRAMRYCWCHGTGARMMRQLCFFGSLSAANLKHFVLTSVSSCMAQTEWSTG